MKIRKNSKVKTHDSKFDFIIGDCGSGKTSYACSIGRKYLKKGYPVYSNVYMEGFRKFDLSDLMRFEFGKGAVIIYDEAATYGLNSRGNASKINTTQEVVEFFTMYRHYSVERIIIISPSFQDVIPVVRNRVVDITVVSQSRLFNFLLFPINIFLRENKIRISHVGKIKKRINVVGFSSDKKVGGEPKEVYFKQLSFKYFILNFTYKYFDSFSCKKLKNKVWHVWGEELKDTPERKELLTRFVTSLNNRASHK